MKTLQECKDQVAKKYNSLSDTPYESWQAMEDKLTEDDDAGWRVDNLLGRADEAAELYARSKWDEACEAQKKIICEYYLNEPKYFDEMILNAPKPEFK